MAPYVGCAIFMFGVLFGAPMEKGETWAQIVKSVTMSAVLGALWPISICGLFLYQTFKKPKVG